ncbi:hypothetical protein N302_07863, partial [Corvus brachyrhynchos]
GSLGADVATTLTNHQVTLIPTTAKGPLSSDSPCLGGLLVGRSSTSRQGVVVLPGVIDADYTGEIKIMAHTLQPPVTIPQSSLIAQIIPIPLTTNGGTSNSSVRRDHAFGSSGFDVFCILNLAQGPQRQVILQRGAEVIKIQPLFDTGADITIIN